MLVVPTGASDNNRVSEILTGYKGLQAAQIEAYWEGNALKVHVINLPNDPRQEAVNGGKVNLKATWQETYTATIPATPAAVDYRTVEDGDNIVYVRAEDNFILHTYEHAGSLRIRGQVGGTPFQIDTLFPLDPNFRSSTAATLARSEMLTFGAGHGGIITRDDFAALIGEARDPYLGLLATNHVSESDMTIAGNVNVKGSLQRNGVDVGTGGGGGCRGGTDGQVLTRRGQDGWEDHQQEAGRMLRQIHQPLRPIYLGNLI